MQEIAAREDTDEAADQDLDQDHQDGTEKEMIEDEEAELLTDTTETEDTTEKDVTDIEAAEGLLPIPDLTKEVSEAEEAIEEIGTETMTEETVIETETLVRIDVEGEEELVPGAQEKGLFIRKGRNRREVIQEPEAVKEERKEENLEEKDLDPDLEATAEKIQKDLEALVQTSVVKEIQTVLKGKTTIMPPASTKETVNLLKDLEHLEEHQEEHQEEHLEIKVKQIKTITRIKEERPLKTKMKTTSELKNN